MNRLAFVLHASVILYAVTACTSAPRRDAESSSTRHTALAERLSREGSMYIASDPKKAESLLRDAIRKDLFYGPAHNNLGVLYLEQDRLYEAAGEFEWARKLMPGHPDPRVNLALTLERAGRNDDALETYRTALEVYPDHIAALQGLVRLQLRTGKCDGTTSKHLEEVALRGEDSSWRTWAQAELLRRGIAQPAESSKE